MRRLFTLLSVVVLVGGLLVACSDDDKTSSGSGSGAYEYVNDDTLTVGTNLPAPGFWDAESPDDVKLDLSKAEAVDRGRVLLDEITSALDPELVASVLELVRELAGEGMTMMLATHEMSFAREVADRVCFLDEGVIAEAGPPGQIFTEPRNPRTAEFLRRIIAAGRL